MENKGLLFIPDISGFTRFVNESEIEHSRLIIQELLELLLNANALGLQVSEIEGDAILFYKFGASPELEDLYKQVEKMFCDFHHHLNKYERGRFCQCQACISAINLTLKVITHYGEFTDYQVKNFRKLIGKDVIVAHQLLKNDIEDHEYWLVTNSLLPEDPPTLAQWIKWYNSVQQTQSGEIPYHYTQLGPLKKIMPPPPLQEIGLDKKAKVISVSKTYETNMITMFHATGDVRFRHRWQEGVQGVEHIEYILPRVGMRFSLLQDKGQRNSFYSSCSYHPERIVFSETEEKKECSTCFILERIGEECTRLTMEYYVQKNPAAQVLFQLTRKREVEAAMKRSLHRLDTLVEEIKQPAEAW